MNSHADSHAENHTHAGSDAATVGDVNQDHSDVAFTIIGDGAPYTVQANDAGMHILMEALARADAAHNATRAATTSGTAS